ncbi:uncharacterized protein [Ptychodera flava]|uniref:uncharacterized protein n=1 Tax=Ptychodera flava TaxID=63121 RepID=UPI003969CD93
MKTTILVVLFIFTLILDLLVPVAHAQYEDENDNDDFDVEDFDFYKRDPYAGRTLGSSRRPSPKHNQRQRSRQLRLRLGPPQMKRLFGKAIKRDNPVKTDTAFYLATLARLCAAAGGCGK